MLMKATRNKLIKLVAVGWALETFLFQEIVRTDDMISVGSRMSGIEGSGVGGVSFRLMVSHVKAEMVSSCRLAEDIL